ncbi:unnamed protein product [Spirodela intermedia]|uniref:AB hydrolase-1 domain-containing protein n=1 Tax=Spirodela intermedia TaxID=51605 RepID=A0A7I8ITS0_SPIIN|nr:unnamed protein product [Spirodela intermedia]CAA6661386.1 unnamed protein product [Spirodela intermedia]
MVNWVEAQKPIVHGLAKLAGLRQRTVELEPGTVMSFWVPKKNDKQKPPVVLVHGFAGEGIVTWQFQVGALTKRYAVYVPDLFPGDCLGRALALLGVQRCTLVGFSYGGMVAFKLAEARPEMVRSMVVSGSVVAMTSSIGEEALARLGFKSSAELLLPNTLKGNKALLSVATYRKYWFPDRLHKDFIKVMFSNRKEREELLEGLEDSNREFTLPANLPQHILLLWGENDRIFKIELAQDMKEKLGEKAAVHSISKAGHLVHLERPCVYNRCLKGFLAKVHSSGSES